MKLTNTAPKAGILGGGQLGRMLLQQAINYPVTTYLMENDVQCPSAHLCHYFIKGDIQNFDDVYNFGKNLDLLTIEIESVNVEALEQLEQEGLVVRQPGLRDFQEARRLVQIKQALHGPERRWVPPLRKTAFDDRQCLRARIRVTA